MCTIGFVLILRLPVDCKEKPPGLCRMDHFQVIVIDDFLPSFSGRKRIAAGRPAGSVQGLVVHTAPVFVRLRMKTRVLEDKLLLDNNLSPVLSVPQPPHTMLFVDGIGCCPAYEEARRLPGYGAS